MIQALSDGWHRTDRFAPGGDRGGFGGTAGGLFVGVVCVLPGGGLFVGVANSEGGGGSEFKLEVLGQLRTSPSCKGGGGGGNESRLSVLPVKSSGDEGVVFIVPGTSADSWAAGEGVPSSGSTAGCNDKSGGTKCCCDSFSGLRRGGEGNVWPGDKGGEVR